MLILGRAKVWAYMAGFQSEPVTRLSAREHGKLVVLPRAELAQTFHS
jgi:hypothetical protein